MKKFIGSIFIISFFIFPLFSRASITEDTIVGVGEFYTFATSGLVKNIPVSSANFYNFYQPLLASTVRVYSSIGENVFILTDKSIEGIRGVGEVSLGALSFMFDSTIEATREIKKVPKEFNSIFYPKEF